MNRFLYVAAIALYPIAGAIAVIDLWPIAHLEAIFVANMVAAQVFEKIEDLVNTRKFP